LDTLEQNPVVLLSAGETKSLLREIIEGFFFRRLKGEGGKHIRRPSRLTAASASAHLR
jgi:hypothetical protein